MTKHCMLTSFRILLFSFYCRCWYFSFVHAVFYNRSRVYFMTYNIKLGIYVSIWKKNAAEGFLLSWSLFSETLLCRYFHLPSPSIAFFYHQRSLTLKSGESRTAKTRHLSLFLWPFLLYMLQKHFPNIPILLLPGLLASNEPCRSFWFRLSELSAKWSMNLQVIIWTVFLKWQIC